MNVILCIRQVLGEMAIAETLWFPRVHEIISLIDEAISDDISYTIWIIESNFAKKNMLFENSCPISNPQQDRNQNSHTSEMNISYSEYLHCFYIEFLPWEPVVLVKISRKFLQPYSSFIPGELQIFTVYTQVLWVFPFTLYFSV